MDIKNIKPTPGHLLIKPLKEEKTTASGIVLPDSHEGEKPQVGTVVAIGSEETLDNGQIRKAPCREGDKVVYKKWAGNEYKPEGSEIEHLFVKFEDIMAIIN